MMYGTKFNARIHVKYLKINLHIIFSICIVVQSFKIAVWIIPVIFLVAMRLQNVCKCPVHPLWNRPYIYIYIYIYMYIYLYIFHTEIQINNATNVAYSKVGNTSLYIYIYIYILLLGHKRSLVAQICLN